MSFLWPWLLLSLLLVPALIGAYLIALQRRRQYTISFTNLDLLKEVAGEGPGIKRHIPPLLFLIGLAALLFSLSRPVMNVALPRTRTAVMLVLDVSYSMNAEDLKPTRIAAAQQSAKQFVAQLPATALVGLVSFSGKANLNAPLTLDHNAVLEAIDTLKLDNGTAIGDGLMQALEHIASQGQQIPSNIILLSDGESSSGYAPLEAAARAEQMKIEVNTVGIGQRGTRTQINANQSVGLDEDTLRAIAQRTGGGYFYAAQTSDLEDIYKNLSTNVSLVREPTEVTAIAAGIGALFLVAAALLSLAWFQQFP
jgi:Ca-activated chloride channel family protein